MSEVFIYTIVSVIIVSLLAFAGIIILAIKQKHLKKILLLLVSFAAGALLGNVFIHLLPELIHEGGFNLYTSIYILFGIILFFVLEKILHWRHCHLSATKEHTHPLAHMNLVGDAVHNFIDGMLIAGSYMLSIPVGIATTIAVILHEIPQEMGDFGVLLHSGMKIKKALFYNFISALFAVIGAIVILLLNVEVGIITGAIIPITIGGFLYIANSDLIPELHKDTKIGNSLGQLISLILGVGIMFILTVSHPHSHSNVDDHDHTNHAEQTHNELDHREQIVTHHEVVDECEYNEINVKAFHNRLHNIIHIASGPQDVINFIEKDSCVKDGSVNERKDGIYIKAIWKSNEKTIDFAH